MLTIRLTRKGKKNQPFFRIVVIDKRRSSKGGRAVEDLGYKNPLTKKISINKERVLYWIKNGAQPSSTVHNLLVSEKIIEGKKIHVARVKKSAEAAAPAAPAATAPVAGATAPAVETTPKEEPQPLPEAPASEAKPEPAEEPKPEEAKPEQPAA